MGKKEQFDGFTIMEVIIAMMVAAIVISITYTVYEIVTHQFNKFQNDQETFVTLQRLDEALKSDFEHSSKINKAGQTVSFEGSRAVTYRFTQDSITRMTRVSETFKVSVSGLRSSFTLDSSSTGATIPRADSLINNLSFEILLKGEPLPYFYHKVYSSENLVNYPHAGN
jgi:prepilin-type N-terminal cleavage/methylation domain-containing protein